MTARFGMWSGLWRSAWDAHAYRAAAVSSSGRMFGYLALLIALATIVFTAQLQISLTQVVREFKISKLWERNLPEIQITDGVVTSPVPQPFTWELDNFVFVLDTTGTITDLDPAYRTGILLTRTEVTVHRQRRIQETRRYALDQFPDLVLNQESVERILEQIQAWGWLAIGFGVMVWLWIAKLVQVVWWSLLGVAVSVCAKRSLRYGAIFNIGIVAATLPMAFDLVTRVLGWRHWSLGWVSLAMYLGYVIWGVLAQPTPQATEAASSTMAGVGSSTS